MEPVHIKLTRDACPCGEDYCGFELLEYTLTVGDKTHEGTYNIDGGGSYDVAEILRTFIEAVSKLQGDASPCGVVLDTTQIDDFFWKGENLAF